MSKTLLDAPIYIDTYKRAGRLYDLCFALPKRKYKLKSVLVRKYRVRL